MLVGAITRCVFIAKLFSPVSVYFDHQNVISAIIAMGGSYFLSWHVFAHDLGKKMKKYYHGPDFAFFDFGRIIAPNQLPDFAFAKLPKISYPIKYPILLSPNCRKYRTRSLTRFCFDQMPDNTVPDRWPDFGMLRVWMMRRECASGEIAAEHGESVRTCPNRVLCIHLSTFRHRARDDQSSMAGGHHQADKHAINIPALWTLPTPPLCYIHTQQVNYDWTWTWHLRSHFSSHTVGRWCMHVICTRVLWCEKRVGFSVLFNKFYSTSLWYKFYL